MAGNWKMNLNHLEAIAHVQKLAFALTDKDYAAVEVAVLPPFTDLRSVQTLVDGDRLKIKYGAQDVSAHDSGAYTGEISGPMLAKLEVHLRRDRPLRAPPVPRRGRAIVNAKVKAAFRHGLTPILCVGEGLEVRKAGEQVAHTLAQLDGALKDVPAEQAATDRRRLRAGLGDRHRRGRHPARTPRRSAGRSAAGWPSCTTQRAGRRGAHPVRRLGQGRERGRDHGPAGRRRRPGRRRRAGRRTSSSRSSASATSDAPDEL